MSLARSCLDALTLREATDEVVKKLWRTEHYEVYLDVDGVPARVTFGEDVVRKALSGNATPLEWRLGRELGREDVEIAGDVRVLVESWLSAADVYEGWSR